MRPIASDQSHTFLALNEVFGTKGQVRLLRFLSTETHGPVPSSEIAARAGMTPSGVRKALNRLAQAGVVERVGDEKPTRYALKSEGKLADEIVRLFELEREGMDSGLGTERSRRASAEVGKGSGNGGSDGGRGSSGSRDGGRNGVSRGNGDGGSSGSRDGGRNGVSRGNGDGSGNRLSRGNGSANQEIASSGRNLPGFYRHLDPEDPVFHEGLLALIDENLSLIKRARERVLERLENRHPNNGHDDWEWRKILDTYPLPRLLHFLASDSPRAVRLRQSSPFAEVLSERERERLGELVGRVH